MGGNAFANTLSTPRMPPVVYSHVRDQTLAALRKYYKYAESPIEAPGKSDHGDVDILVAEPLIDVKVETLADELGAQEVKRVRGSSTTHFALPWPRQITTDEVGLDDLEKVLLASETTSFIQLDLHVCLDNQKMQWELFQQAHGDLWNIIGGIIRKFGLTCTNSGFYLRIEELEGYNKEMARVKLTEDPAIVLKFLGLDVDRFWRPFDSLETMMAYAAACRFHNPERGASKDQNRAELKANDRQRASKRPAFAIWIDDYLPAHRGDPAGNASSMTREEVIEDVKRAFGEAFANAFNEHKAKSIRLMGIDKLWASIRKDLPIEGIEVGYVMKGIKKEVVGDAEGAVGLNEVQQAYKNGNFDGVLTWAHENWKEVGQRQKAFDREKSTRNLLDKLEREKVKKGKGNAEEINGVRWMR